MFKQKTQNSQFMQITKNGKKTTPVNRTVISETFSDGINPPIKETKIIDQNINQNKFLEYPAINMPLSDLINRLHESNTEFGLTVDKQNYVTSSDSSSGTSSDSSDDEMQLLKNNPDLFNNSNDFVPIVITSLKKTKKKKPVVAAKKKKPVVAAKKKKNAATAKKNKFNLSQLSKTIKNVKNKFL